MMNAKTLAVLVAASLTACSASAQTTNDPFKEPVVADRDIVTVRFVEFGTVPDLDGQPARMMLLVQEPGGERFFVNDMEGVLYTIGPDGGAAALYLDLRDAKWGLQVEANGSERGFQNFELHPEFNQAGAPGYGRFYTYLDTRNTEPAPDFTPGGGDDTHDTILLEWTARTPGAAAYDGGPPRELMRFEQPFRNHNAGDLRFNPLARPGSEDYGLLYVGSADGGSGGDPLGVGQNLASAFGKILRIDPLGTSSANGRYGIPPGNPFVGRAGALGEIYALGTRNPQRFWWDPKTGNMFFAEIGQNIVEEVSPVTAGANLGWNAWEGSFRFISRQAVNVANPRGDASMTYPIAEYDQQDPLFQPSCCAATGGFVYRSDRIPQLTNLLVFGDNPSGEILYVRADPLPDGGQDEIRRILFDDNGTRKRLVELIDEKNAALGRPRARRVDLRFGEGRDDQIFILNKQDGVIRLLVPGGEGSD